MITHDLLGLLRFNSLRYAPPVMTLSPNLATMRYFLLTGWRVQPPPACGIS